MRPPKLPSLAAPFVAALSAAILLGSLPLFATEALRPEALPKIAALSATQLGTLPKGPETGGRLVLANEPDASAGVALDFDLESVTDRVVPLARIQMGEVAKIKVSRPGEPPSVERGVMHALVRSPAGETDVAGTMPMKPGGTVNAYMLEITDAVNAVLARPKGQRKLHVEVRITGKPIPFEVYALPAAKPVLEVAPAANWTDDWQQQLTPIDQDPTVYREACFPLTDRRDHELALRLLYPAKKILSVIHDGTGEKLHEGRDWILRDGQLVLPVGTTAPIELEAEFYRASHKEKDGTIKLLPSQIHLQEGPWYHDRQIEVTYEPAERDWSFPSAISTLDALPRFKQKLATHAPVSIILFGDSIFP